MRSSPIRHGCLEADSSLLSFGTTYVFLSIVFPDLPLNKSHPPPLLGAGIAEVPSPTVCGFGKCPRRYNSASSWYLLTDSQSSVQKAKTKMSV